MVNFWILPFLFSCIDQEPLVDQIILKERVEAFGLEFIGLNKNESSAFKVNSLEELDIFLTHISGKSASPKEILDLYKKMDL